MSVDRGNYAARVLLGDHSGAENLVREVASALVPPAEQEANSDLPGWTGEGLIGDARAAALAALRHIAAQGGPRDLAAVIDALVAGTG